MHAETRALMRECDIALPHVFPYSERAGTPAARMPQVAVAARKARAAELRAVGAELRERLLSRRLGARVRMLMETATEGRTEHFVRARLSSPRAPGRVVAARLAGHDGERWFAEARVSGGLTRRGRGWIGRLKAGLGRTAQSLGGGLAGIFGGRKLDDAALKELEELLIAADLGAATAAQLAGNLKRRRFGRETGADEARRALADDIAEILAPVAQPLRPRPGRAPHIVLVVGVNGTGKTTTIGKLAGQWRREGSNVMLAACDTFRAAAVEQLQVWGARAGAAGDDRKTRRRPGRPRFRRPGPGRVTKAPTC